MPKIDINLRYSRQFLILLSLTVLSCTVIIFSLPLPVWLKIVLLAATLLYAYHCTAFPIIGLRYTRDHWEVRDRSGWIPVQLLGESTVTTRVSLLRFKHILSKKRYTSLVLRDSLEHENYQKLVACLRTTKHGISP